MACRTVTNNLFIQKQKNMFLRMLSITEEEIGKINSYKAVITGYFTAYWPLFLISK